MPTISLQEQLRILQKVRKRAEKIYISRIEKGEKKGADTELLKNLQSL